MSDNIAYVASQTPSPVRDVIGEETNGTPIAEIDH